MQRSSYTVYDTRDPCDGILPRYIVLICRYQLMFFLLGGCSQRRIERSARTAQVKGCSVYIAAKRRTSVAGLMILHAQRASDVQRSKNMNEMSVSGGFLPAQHSLCRLSHLLPSPPLSFSPMSAASDDRLETLCRTVCYKNDRAH
jgi:hypothetical protein